MKVGAGGIPETLIEQAQTVMRTFKTDFKPTAKRLLNELTIAIDTTLKQIKNNEHFEKDTIIFPIMQLKANSGMFQYELLTDVSDICLQFMEAIDDLNEDSMQIIKAHENTIDIIIKSDLKGDGGKEGYILVQELHRACTRYFKKHKR